MPNNSIFELADKFGIQSPFGDWLPPKEETPSAKITDIQVSRGTSFFAKKNAMSTAQQYVPIIIAVTVEGFADKVEVTYGNSRSFARKNMFGQYEATIPVSTDIYFPNSSHTFKISVYDLYTKKLSHTQSVVVDLGEHNQMNVKKEQEVKLEVKKPQNTNNTGCYCNRDFSVEDVKQIVKQLRNSEGVKSTALFFSKNCKLPNEDKTYDKLTEQLNKTLEKYEINTCIRKIHFLAQIYLETDRLKTLLEYGADKKDYAPYVGRGFMQLTHKSNYAAYTAFYDDTSGRDDDFVINYNQVCTNIFFAMDSAGWYCNRGKILKVKPEWTASSNAPSYVKKYNAKFPTKNYKYKYNNKVIKYSAVDLNLMADKDYIDLISYFVNGGGNGLNERRLYLEQLKKIMKYNEYHNK